MKSLWSKWRTNTNEKESRPLKGLLTVSLLTIAPLWRLISLMENDELNEGYVLSWRKIMKTSWYTNPLTCHLAEHCIRRANWEDKKIYFAGSEIMLPRGTFLTGLRSLSKETGISMRSLRSGLNTLKATQFLTIKATHKFSLISIVKYNEYQLQATQRTTQRTTHKRHSSDTVATTDNELKAFKEVKETTSPPQKPAADPRISNLVKCFHDSYMDIYNKKPVIQGGKDGNLLKSRLKLEDENTIKIMMKNFLTSKDSFLDSLPKTISVFCSSAVFEKLRKLKPQLQPQSRPFTDEEKRIAGIQ